MRHITNYKDLNLRNNEVSPAASRGELNPKRLNKGGNMYYRELDKAKERIKTRLETIEKDGKEIESMLGINVCKDEKKVRNEILVCLSKVEKSTKPHCCLSYLKEAKEKIESHKKNISHKKNNAKKDLDRYYDAEIKDLDSILFHIENVLKSPDLKKKSLFKFFELN